MSEFEIINGVKYRWAENHFSYEEAEQRLNEFKHDWESAIIVSRGPTDYEKEYYPQYTEIYQIYTRGRLPINPNKPIKYYE